MWTCPRCERNFKSVNQSHMCTTKTIDDLFVNRPDNLVLAFDRLLTEVIDWEPCSVGTSTNTIIFTSQKAWLIVKPMTKELDIKFYSDQVLENDRFKKVTDYNGKFAYHIRVREEYELTEEVFRLLKIGHQYSLQ